ELVRPGARPRRERGARPRRGGAAAPPPRPPRLDAALRAGLPRPRRLERHAGVAARRAPGPPQGAARLRERARGAHGPRRAAARAVLLGDDLVADRLVRAARGLPHLPAGPHARDGAAAGAVRRRAGEDDRGLL